jgi:hypothetical protein
MDVVSTSTNITIAQDINADGAVAARLLNYSYQEDLIEHRFEDYVTDSIIRISAVVRDQKTNITGGSLYATGHLAFDKIEHKILFGVDKTIRDGKQVNKSNLTSVASICSTLNTSGGM